VLRLQTHPGIGLLTSPALVHALEPVSRFSGGRKVAAYVGLDPVEYSSGEKQRFGSISKGGSRLLRYLLVEAARITVGRATRPARRRVAPGRCLDADGGQPLARPVSPRPQPALRGGAARAAAVWRQAPDARRLDRTLCLKEQRVVGRDHVVSFAGLQLQVPRLRKFFSLAVRRVEVLQLRDQNIELHHGGELVALEPQAAQGAGEETASS
jgi:hypothetical protein